MCNYNGRCCCCNRQWNWCQCRQRCCYPQPRANDNVNSNKGQPLVRQPIQESLDEVFTKSAQAKETPVAAQNEQDNRTDDSSELLDLAEPNQVNSATARSLSLPTATLQEQKDSSSSDPQRDIKKESKDDFSQPKAFAREKLPTIKRKSFEKKNIQKYKIESSDQRQVTKESIKNKETISDLKTTNDIQVQSKSKPQEIRGKTLPSKSKLSDSFESAKVSVNTKSTADSNSASSKPNKKEQLELLSKFNRITRPDKLSSFPSNGPTQTKEPVELPSKFNRFTKPKVAPPIKPNKPFKPITQSKSAKVDSGDHIVKKVEQKPKSKPKRVVKKKTGGELQAANTKQEPDKTPEESKDIWFECSVPFRVSIPNTICYPSPWDLLQSTLCNSQAWNNNNNLKALTTSKNDTKLTLPSISGSPQGKMCITVRPMGFGPKLPFPTQPMIHPMGFGGSGSITSPPAVRPMDFVTNGLPSPPLKKGKVNLPTQRGQNGSNSQKDSNKTNEQSKTNSPSLKNILEVIYRCVCKQKGKKKEITSLPRPVRPKDFGHPESTLVNPQNMTQNNDLNNMSLAPPTQGFPRESSNNTLEKSTANQNPQQTMIEHKNIEPEFQLTPQVRSVELSTQTKVPLVTKKPSLRTLEYKTPYHSAHSIFSNTPLEKEYWDVNESDESYKENLKYHEEQYMKRGKKPEPGISKTPSTKKPAHVTQEQKGDKRSTKGYQSSTNKVTKVKMCARLVPAALVKSTKNRQVGTRNSASESAPQVMSLKDQTVNKGKSDHSASPVESPRSSSKLTERVFVTEVSASSFSSDESIAEDSRGTKTQYLEKSMEEEGLTKDCICCNCPLRKRQNFKKSVEDKRLTLDCNCPLKRKQPLDTALRKVAGRSLPKINTQFLRPTTMPSDKSTYVRTVKTVFKPIRRFPSSSNNTTSQEKRNYKTKNIKDETNNMKDLSDSRFVELPQRKYTSNGKTQNFRGDSRNTSKNGKPMTFSTDNIKAKKRVVPILNGNDSRLVFVLPPPPILQDSNVHRNKFNPQMHKKPLKAPKDFRPQLNAAYPKSGTSISESIIQLIRHANKRHNEGKTLSDQSLYLSDQDYFEGSDFDHNRNQKSLSRQSLYDRQSSVCQLPNNRNPKDLKLCLLKRKNGNSSATLEEYNVTAFSRSFSKHPLQKGGSEFGSCISKGLHLETVRPINILNVDDVLSEVKDYCKSRCSARGRSEKLVVLVPFRKDNKHDRMTIYEPDEWKEFELPIPKASIDRGTRKQCFPQSSSSDEAFQQNNCTVCCKNCRTGRRAHDDESPNIQAKNRSPSKVYKAPQSPGSGSTSPQSSIDIKKHFASHKSNNDYVIRKSQSEEFKREIVNNSILIPNNERYNANQSNDHKSKLQIKDGSHVNRLEYSNSESFSIDSDRQKATRSKVESKLPKDESWESFGSSRSLCYNAESLNRSYNNQYQLGVPRSNSRDHFREPLQDSLDNDDSSISSIESTDSHQRKQTHTYPSYRGNIREVDSNKSLAGKNMQDLRFSQRRNDSNDLSSSDDFVDISPKTTKANMNKNETSNLPSSRNYKSNNYTQITGSNKTIFKFIPTLYEDHNKVKVLLNPRHLSNSSRDNRVEANYRIQENQTKERNTEGIMSQGEEQTSDSCRCAELERQNQELRRELRQLYELMQKDKEFSRPTTFQPQMPQNSSQSQPTPEMTLSQDSNDRQYTEWQRNQSLQDCRCYGKWLEIRDKKATQPQQREMRPEQSHKQLQAKSFKQQTPTKQNRQQFQAQTQWQQPFQSPQTQKDKTLEYSLQRQPTRIVTNDKAVQYSNSTLELQTKQGQLSMQQYPESSQNPYLNQNGGRCYCIAEGLRSIPPDIYQKTLNKYGIKAMPCNCQQTCCKQTESSCQCGCQKRQHYYK